MSQHQSESLRMHVGFLSYALALLAGLLTTVSPCVLPIVPILLGTAINVHRRALSSNVRELSDSPYPTGGIGPSAILTTEYHVYVANKSVSGSTTGNIADFAITQTGSEYSFDSDEHHCRRYRHRRPCAGQHLDLCCGGKFGPGAGLECLRSIRARIASWIL